jgi:hypothetical protein
MRVQFLLPRTYHRALPHKTIMRQLSHPQSLWLRTDRTTVTGEASMSLREHGLRGVLVVLPVLILNTNLNPRSL